jgi:hypothetical protein
MDNQIAPNAKTSDYYRTQNLPARFENPGKFSAEIPSKQNHPSTESV